MSLRAALAAAVPPQHLLLPGSCSRELLTGRQEARRLAFGTRGRLRVKGMQNQHNGKSRERGGALRLPLL